jgi:hypothetical protein
LDANLIIKEIKACGARLEASGGMILLRGGSRVPQEFKDRLRKFKPQILALLTGECTCTWGDTGVLLPPHYCERCGETGLCRDCGGCRTCWLIRMGIVVGRRPRG